MATLACSGQITGTPSAAGNGGQAAGGNTAGGGGQPNTPALEMAAPARVRRLTAAEILRSATDVFLDGATAKSELSDQSLPHRFDNWFEALSVPTVFADSLAMFAESVATQAAGSPSLMAGCVLAREGEEACMARFLATRGRRAYRRPLSQSEADGLMQLWRGARALTGFEASVAVVIEAMLQSPAFLFRTELGTTTGATIRRLDHYEIASALSYFLWGTAPDDELLTAAEDGALAGDDGVRAQAKRLVKDQRAKPIMQSFVKQWLEIPDATKLVRDQTAYPAFGDELARSMNFDFAALVDATLWNDEGLEGLLTASTAMVDAHLAPIYGLSATDFSQPRQVRPENRAGVLTNPAFVAAHSPAAGFSPVFLGNLVRRRLLCQLLPNPPADVPSLPSATESVSSRERFANHLSSATCRSCHVLIDPIGFGFERYDGIGRHRSDESGVPLTGKGELTETDVDGPFTGPAELGKRLAASAVVQTCFAANFLEFALGRDAALVPSGLDVDRTSIESARLHVNGTLSDMLVAIASSRAFLYRDVSRVPREEAP